MLRVSAKVTETEIDIQGINGSESAAGAGVQYGTELMKFAEAVANRDEQALTEARSGLLEVSDKLVLVDASAVAANFQRMVRIADAMGIPVDDMDGEVSKQVREELDLNRFSTAQHSLAS